MEKLPLLRPLPDERQVPVLAGVTGLFWLAQAVGCYLTVYLQGEGFSAGQLGVLNALCAGVAILSVSFWGTLCDRLGSLRRVFVAVLVTGCALYALVPLLPTGKGWSAGLVIGYMGFVTLFRGAQGTLAENILVRNCNELRLSFGPLRSMGSLFYAAASLTVAFLLPHIGVKNTFWLSGACMLPVVLLVLLAREPAAGAGPARPREKLDLGRLFQSRPYVLLLIFASLFYMANACGANFIPFFMNGIGVSSRRYGLLLGYRALLEIPFLLLMSRLRRRFPLRMLVAVGALLMGLESICLGLFVESMTGLLLAATFYGLGNGLFIGSSLNYVYELAPDDLKASAQAFYTSVAQVACILGNLLGGLLFDGLGAHPYYRLVGGMYLCSVLVFLLSSLEHRTALRPLPAGGPRGGHRPPWRSR